MSINYTISNYVTTYDNTKCSGWSFTPLITGTQLGGFVYANPTNVTFAAHIKNFIEPCAGAHYYAQAPFCSNYQSASMTVNLSEVQVNRANGKRNAYICLGFVSEGSTFRHADIGLQYAGNNRWEVFAWGQNVSKTSDIPWTWSKGQGLAFTNGETVKVDIAISKSGNNHILSCDFYVGSTLKASCTTSHAVGQMFDEDSGGPRVRFVRFMSLVPNNLTNPGAYDDADGSYLNGRIRNLKLGGATWDYSKIQYAWSIQEANITDLKLSILNATSIGTDADSINILHNVQTH